MDPGEASAIALALESKDCLLIIDDLKARKAALKFHLKITGTLGVIAKAKQLGILSDMQPIVNALLQNDFRISSTVLDEIFKKLKE